MCNPSTKHLRQDREKTPSIKNPLHSCHSGWTHSAFNFGLMTNLYYTNSHVVLFFLCMAFISISSLVDRVFVSLALRLRVCTNPLYHLMFVVEHNRTHRVICLCESRYVLVDTLTRCLMGKPYGPGN